MKDDHVLKFAAENQRVLVSHDVATMPAHFHTFRVAGNHSAGVFLIPQSLATGTAIEDLVLIWLASERASGFVTGAIVRVDGGFSAMTI